MHFLCNWCSSFVMFLALIYFFFFSICFENKNFIFFNKKTSKSRKNVNFLKFVNRSICCKVLKLFNLRSVRKLNTSIDWSWEFPKQDTPKKFLKCNALKSLPSLLTFSKNVKVSKFLVLYLLYILCSAKAMQLLKNLLQSLHAKFMYEKLQKLGGSRV